MEWLRYFRGIRFRWIILAVSLVFIWWVMGDPQRGEWYALTIYPRIARGLSLIAGWIPFSLNDCLISGGVIGLVVVFLLALLRRWKLGRACRFVVEYLLWIYAWFYLAWGLNYFRQDFFSRTQIVPASYSPERFHSFLRAYTDSLNASWMSVDTVDPKVVREAVLAGYRQLPARFGLLSPGPDWHAKPMLFSRMMSRVGVMGYIGPFFCEPHLNKLLLPEQYPSVYAHEFAHLLGISSEAEANLYSYLVCTRSSEPSIRFSGYFSLLPYVLNNAYAVMDQEAFDAWVKTLSPEVKRAYEARNAYWRSLYSPLIGEVQDWLYDQFLKGNNISSGTGNYGEVIALLLSLEGK